MRGDEIMLKRFIKELRTSKDLRSVVAATVVCLTVCFSVCGVLSYAASARNNIEDFCNTVAEATLDEMSK